MFCYQRSFSNPTELVDEARFWALVKASQWNENIDKYRETHDAALKRKLPAFIFQATFDETTSKSGKIGAWRKQAATRLTGLVVMDIDHVENPKALFEGWGISISKEPRIATPHSHPRCENQGNNIPKFPDSLDQKSSLARILLVYITPSGKGLKVVFKADPKVGNLIDNQQEMAKLLGVEVDESCKDASRMSFICKECDILYLDKELFTYENKEFGERYDALYRDGHSAAERKSAKSAPSAREIISSRENNNLSQIAQMTQIKELSFKGIPYSEIISEWWQRNGGEPQEGERNVKLYQLAVNLRAICDNNRERLLEVMPRLGLDEQELRSIVESACKEPHKGLSKPMREILEKAGTHSPLPLEGSGEDDVYDVLPLDKWAEELQEMAQYYPCMKELFANVHPHKLAAVFFSSAALFGTLMTRAWYHFWYEPEIVRRLNYCIFIIGDPGAGKNVIEKFYKKIADPMIQADSCLIDAVNRYKEGRTERTTSTKAQKGEALKRPVVGIRVHPARTATGEFIRHMNAAIETVEGHPLNLHMFSFDAELDNVTKQNKGGDWKDREIMELKAFHNEEEGQMYANQESFTGMFNVYWNFIYTGTPYALHRKVNQRNFGTGMSTRLAVIPLPDKGLAKRHQQVNPNANETLREWAYRLDKVEGELPIEPLNDETFDWQSSHLEIAEFNGDKADRTLLKRIPYYGIGISLPFILMRHWDEWQESKTLTMDDKDKRLCRLAMDIQYRCQQFFFGEMAYNYFADQNKEFVVRRRTTRFDDCYRKLPDEFKTQQMMDSFQCSQPTASRNITRFLQDGIIKRIAHGTYRKILQELP